ncbi:phage major capsid protein [Bacteroides sp. ET336]|uniref:phage major capsid family protein n=1 Tax=Bacteroides sp. ET336 TaxID=2972459 RepID=UPI0021AC1B2B|nr:phage major capsid protein [Bacteroides sp. ET336]MCR8892437.1 phage major capsid protein [Bacteroides sp. ET336]MDN0056933.1 phage major capsid protein [Bacteroides caecigallinarum]
MKKFTVADFGLKTDGLPQEQATFMNNITKMMCDVINKAMEGTISSEDMEERLKSLNDKLNGYDDVQFQQLKKDNEELIKTVKGLGDTIEKLKSKGIGMDVINKFDEKLNEMLDSEKFKEFASGNCRKSGVFDGFCLKDIVSMTDNYDGDHLITQQQNRVVSQVANKRIHMRDVLTTLQGDPKFPNLAFTQVYDFDRNARYVTENGRLPESSIKAKEVQTGTKRLGTHLPISKRMLKSRVFIRSFILKMLPEAVYQAEDWNILFGDGNGENLLGIVNHTGVLPVETIISDVYVSGSAGSVKSVSGYNSNKDTVVEFTNPQDLILDGMTITFTGATGLTALNSANQLVKMNDRQILLKGVAYTEETSTSDMTFKVSNGAFKSVEEPNSLDVAKTGFAVMTYAQYTPNAIALNPITVNAMESEKDTTGRNLGIIQTINGVKYIAGRPIIETNNILPGKYLIGDFNVAASLVDYTSLTLEWAEDVESKLKNEIVLIAQEEVIFPVYMPWAFAYGDLAALKEAITKA